MSGVAYFNKIGRIWFDIVGGHFSSSYHIIYEECPGFHTEYLPEIEGIIGAVRKGVADAKKQLVEVSLTKASSITHITNGIAGGAKVFIRPAASGTGVIAGGAVRTVLELAGVKNILAKQLGSNSPLNNARATIDALESLRTFSGVAKERGISVEQLYA